MNASLEPLFVFGDVLDFDGVSFCLFCSFLWSVKESLEDSEELMALSDSRADDLRRLLPGGEVGVFGTGDLGDFEAAGTGVDATGEAVAASGGGVVFCFFAGDVMEDDLRDGVVSDNETGVAVNDELYVFRAGDAEVFGGVTAGGETNADARAGDVVDDVELLRFDATEVDFAVGFRDGDAEVDPFLDGVSLGVEVDFADGVLGNLRGEDEAIGGVRGDNLRGDRFCHDDIKGLVILGDE